ncbi:MAG: F0F1 ATP synthase subunit A [Candidatus Yanofskybacteria bacterium]|nr:F0F1 ATP synthase subunit A [Candidatus Yanofskybacteria bacterium]
MAEISIKAETLFHLGVFNFTNSYLLSLIVVGIFASLSFWLRGVIEMIPGKLQSLFELFTEEALKMMDAVLGSRTQSERYFPIVATIFLFVMLSNWMGLLPGTGSLGLTHEIYKHGETEHVLIPLLRAPTSDLNFTIALAIIAVFSVNLLGAMAVGMRTHAGKFFNFKNPIYTFVGLLELVSEFVKIISFSFRLFGNVFAGEVLLIIIGFLGPYFLPLPFLFLEVFVGFIQAFIFAMLTLVFIGMSVSHHEVEH